MSLLKTIGKSGSPLNTLLSDLRTTLAERGSEMSNANLTKNVVALESLNHNQRTELEAAASSIDTTLRGSFKVLSEEDKTLGFESLTDTQLEAGIMVALAAGDPGTYAKAALGNQPSASNGVAVVSAESVGIAGSLDYRDEISPSLEAFDEKELSNMIPYSIVFNVQASRQDEFGEAFYPTTVVSPDNGGLDISVNRTTVHNTVKRSTTGKAGEFDQKNLLEATVDASILADESTLAVPFVQPDNSNLDAFVDAADVAPSIRKVSGVDVTTAPLKVAQQVDILGLSQHPELLGAGIMDHTDALDSRSYLENVYFKIGNAVIRQNVARLPRNGFNKSVEGNANEMALNFQSTAIALSADTKGVDGTTPIELQTLVDNNATAHLKISVSGTMNTQYGSVEVIPGSISVASITDIDGNEISMTAGAGLAIVQALAGLGIIGYDLYAARTNSNRRTRGLLLNNIRETERFPIPLGAPISAPSPLASDREARDLESLVQAARIRNSNNAVTSLLNYADTLRAFVINKRIGHGSTQIEGIARHVVTPFFEEVTIDLKTAMNSIRSKDRAEDVAAVVINAIKDAGYRMLRDSGYQAALDASSMGAKKPRLLVGTDAVIQRHIMQTGESRTFGPAFEDALIVTTRDLRMDGKIVLTFSRDAGAGQADPLSFGTHAWIPELTSSVSVTRDGATYQESMVQPRSRHINNLPVMVVINVVGLKEALVDKTTAPKLDV